MNAHELLVDGRNRIARCGWVQNELGDERMGVCAVGAIHIGASDDESVAFSNAVHLLDDLAGGDIIGFNNADGRTKGEVLAIFDRAIATTAPPPPDLDLTELVEAGVA